MGFRNALEADVRFQLTEEGARQTVAVRQVQQLHNRKPLQQMRQACIRDVTLRPKLLHHPGAHHVVELQETNIRTDNSIQVTTNKKDG